MELVQHHLKTSLGTRINLDLNSSWYFIGIEWWTMEFAQFNLFDMSWKEWHLEFDSWSRMLQKWICAASLFRFCFSSYILQKLKWRQIHKISTSHSLWLIEECQTEIGWTGRYTRSSILGPEKCLKKFNITCWIFYVKFWSSTHSNNLKANQNCNLTRDQNAVLVQFQKFWICSFGAVSKYNSGSWYRTLSNAFSNKKLDFLPPY